jgi:hypothetical protein
MSHSEKILDQLEKVRNDGRVNMLDMMGVQRAAYDMELFTLVTFIEENEAEMYYSALDAMGKRVER